MKSRPAYECELEHAPAQGWENGSAGTESSESVVHRALHEQRERLREQNRGLHACCLGPGWPAACALPAASWLHLCIFTGSFTQTLLISLHGGLLRISSSGTCAKPLQWCTRLRKTPKFLKPWSSVENDLTQILPSQLRPTCRNWRCSR